MKNTQKIPQAVHPYAISIDWLQVYCHIDDPNLENFVPIFDAPYEIVKMSHSTRQFKNVYEIYTLDREEDNPKNTLHNPIKHNRNYRK